MRSHTAISNAIDVEWLEAESIELGPIQPILRKAAPYDDLLPLTLVWADNLPAGAIPEALLREFPRIANHIAASWRDPEVLTGYLDSLLVDRRGGRRGFPPDVLENLVVLSAYRFFARGS